MSMFGSNYDPRYGPGPYSNKSVNSIYYVHARMDDVTPFRSELVALMERCRSVKQLQDIIAALRGPDFQFDSGERYNIETDCLIDLRYLSENKRLDEKALKWFTTARIRALTVPSYNGAVNKRPLTSDEILIRDTMLRQWASSHFKDHYRDAVRAIIVAYRYDLQNEKSMEGEMI